MITSGWVQTGESIYQIAISKLISINVYKAKESFTWSVDIFTNGKPEFVRDFKSSEEAKEAALNRALEIISDGERQILSLLGRIIEI